MSEITTPSDVFWTFHPNSLSISRRTVQVMRSPRGLRVFLRAFSSPSGEDALLSLPRSIEVLDLARSEASRKENAHHDTERKRGRLHSSLFFTFYCITLIYYIYYSWHEHLLYKKAIKGWTFLLTFDDLVNVFFNLQWSIISRG